MSVFLYFHCHEIAGKSLLYVDYDIDCDSTQYYAFAPFVLAVLASFTIALPSVILFYLWIHRNDLYTTKTHQIVGWLYTPFVRGSEFWQVHDLLMKMVLTGMLIYIPPTSRSGAAVLVCVIAIANLNYFQPHKHKILFWLTQVSFITTASKYTIALLLSASKNTPEMLLVGKVLIGLDIFFMVCSVLALFFSLVLLRNRVKEIQEETNNDDRLVQVLPVQNDVDDVDDVEMKEMKENANALREVRLKYGASSDEYKASAQKNQNKE